MKSNYVGVTHQSIGSNWFARIRVNGKRLYLGAYLDEKQAAEAVKQAIFKYRGENVSLKDLRKYKQYTAGEFKKYNWSIKDLSKPTFKG